MTKDEIMKATRKPLTAECYKFDGNLDKLTAWLKSMGCTDIEMSVKHYINREHDTYKLFHYKHPDILLSGIFLLHNNEKYIIFTQDCYGNHIHALSEREFNHLYTIDEEEINE